MDLSDARRSVAVFAADGRIDTLADDGPLRCASLLKPLYAWVTAGVDGWDQHAARSVRLSDNAATDHLVAAGGGLDPLRDRLAAATGVELAAAPTWGRFEVTAGQVATMYAALVACRSRPAVAVAGWMHEVPALYRLGVSTRWGVLTGQGRYPLAAKAGWDVNDDEDLVRTHVVVLGPRRSAVVLTAVPCSRPRRALWNQTLADRGPASVLALHRSWAGPVLHRELVAASRHSL